MAPPPRIPLTCALALVAHLGIAAAPFESSVSASQASEYEVKAAYVFNLLPFTTWPPTAFAADDAPLNLCIAAPSPLGNALERTFQNEHVGPHPVLLKQVTSPAAVRDCHVLFVGAAADSTGTLEQSAQNAPVLTIGESPQFEQRGGIITFVVEDGHVRFDVNQTAATRSRLQFSSKVLQVARRVS